MSLDNLVTGVVCINVSSGMSKGGQSRTLGSIQSIWCALEKIALKHCSQHSHVSLSLHRWLLSVGFGVMVSFDLF